MSKPSEQLLYEEFQVDYAGPGYAPKTWEELNDDQRANWKRMAAVAFRQAEAYRLETFRWGEASRRDKLRELEQDRKIGVLTQFAKDATFAVNEANETMKKYIPNFLYIDSVKAVLANAEALGIKPERNLFTN